MSRHAIYLAAGLPLLIATGLCEQGGSVLGYLLSVALIGAGAWLLAEYIDYRGAERIRAERRERLKERSERHDV